MKISRPKVSKMNTGSVAGGAYGQGRAKTVGEIKSAHHFFAVGGGSQAPQFSRQGNAGPNSGWTDKRRKSGKMF